MKIILSLVVVFIITFFFIFSIVYRGNKTEAQEERMNGLLVTFVSFVLAILPTTVVAIFLFALLGSVNIVNELFSLEVDLNQLIILSIAFLFYLFTVDHIVEMIVKNVIGKNLFYYIVTLLSRVIIFVIISAIIGLNDKVSVTLALGVAFIVFCFDFVYDRKEKMRT